MPSTYDVEFEDEEEQIQDAFSNDFFQDDTNNNESIVTERRSFSCASCILFDSKNPIKTTETGGFPMRRVASCSVCCWDFDENSLSIRDSDIQRSSSSSDSRATSSSLDDSYITSNISELKSSNSFRSAGNLTDGVFEFQKKLTDQSKYSLNTAEDKPNSDICSLLPPLRRTDSYNSAINIEEGNPLKDDFGGDLVSEKLNSETSLNVSRHKNKHKRSFIDKAFKRNKQRTPPDGGETNRVITDDHLRSKNLSSVFVSSENKDSFDCELRHPTISISATKELDEIFGKITRVPQINAKEEEEEDEEDYFNCYSNKGISNQKEKSKQVGFLMRFSPRRSIRKMPRSRSLNNLYESSLPDSRTLIERTQSSMEISTIMDYDVTYDGLEAEDSDSWNCFLKKINGVSLLEKNLSLRLLWQKLASHQDFAQLFEESMRCIVEEMQQVHKKYEGLETLFASKLENQEKERAKIYDDVETVIQQERQYAQEKIVDMEAQLRSEHQKVIESRDLEIQTVLRINNDLSAKNSKYKEEYDILKSTTEMVEQQISQFLNNEDLLKKENAILIEEKILLLQRLDQTEEVVKNLKEDVAKLKKEVEFEKEKYKICLRQHNDLLEEKVFLDSNVDTLTAALSNLKKQNEYLINVKDASKCASIETHFIRVEPNIEALKYEKFEIDNFKFAEATEDEVTNEPGYNSALENKSEHQIHKPSAQRKYPVKMSSSFEIKGSNINNPKTIYSPLTIKTALNADEWPLSPPEILQENEDKYFPHSALTINKKPHSDIFTAPDQIAKELLSSFENINENHPIENGGGLFSRYSQPCSYDCSSISQRHSFDSNTSVQRHSFENSSDFLTSTPTKSYIKSPEVRSPPMIRFAESQKVAYKIIFIGDSNVGKTSFIRRVCYGKFRATREETLECDFSTICLNSDDGNKVSLNLWDTMGQERFNSIPRSYFRKSDLVVLMYDVTEEASFFSVKNWIRVIHDFTDENVFLMIVANKIDLSRNVSFDKGSQLAKDHDAMFIETSAKTGENVDQFCEMVLSTLLDREDTALIRKDFNSSLCNLSYSKRRQVTTCCS